VFRLAHLTDLHLAPLPSFPTRALASRRLLGWLSWQQRRHRVHRKEVLDALIEDVHAEAPDHVVVTGDLVNLALPVEFVQAGIWLERLGAPEWITAIPGNHDAYVPLPWLGAWSHVGPWMRGDEDEAAAEAVAGTFPFLRRRGPLALIGLSTAVANTPTFAQGRLGRPQLEALRDLLEDVAAPDVCRVVLLHHPPVDDMTHARRRLIDSRALQKVIGEVGAELVLCGHNHVFQFREIAGPDGPVPVFAAPSASLTADHRGRFGGYQLYGLERARGRWQVEVELRRFDMERERFRPELKSRVRAAAGRPRLALEPAE
jgi:3',5'-cyclic AMP phosphodiesterase CpdA